MPDWTESAPPPSVLAKRAAPAEAGVEAEVMAMDVFFGTTDAGEAKGVLAELNREVLTERKANIYYGLALDKMFKVGANIKTSMFIGLFLDLRSS